MEHTILETVPLATHDQSNKRKSKKRKKSISNSNPQDICLQKKSRLEGGVSQSPATGVDAKADAEVSQSQIKGNDKACIIRSGDTNAVSNTNISCASEDRKTDIVCQSLKTEAAASTICNQSQDHENPKRKKSRKRKKSISNSGSTCEANASSSQEKSHHGEGLYLSAATSMCNQAVAEASVPQRNDRSKSGSSCLDREAANVIISDHPNVVSQDIGTVPSTLCDQNKELKAEKRKKCKMSKKNNDSIVNADTNCDPDGIASEKRSSSGEGLSLPSAGGTNVQEDAKVSQLQLKRNDKAQSSHLDREAINGTVSGHSNNAVIQTIERDPSTKSDQNKEPKSKKGKKRRKSKENNEAIANIDSNCDPDHVSSQKTSCFGEEMSLSSAGVAHIPADFEGSLLLLEDNDKARSSHVDGGAASGIQSGHAIAVINQILETAPSTMCDQNKELKAKKRKKQKKSKKNNDNALNADSNCDPDGFSSEKRSYFGEGLSLPSAGGTNIQADAKVSQLQLKENDEAQSSHLDREACNGTASGHSNNAVTQTIERAPSTTFDQNKEHKSKKGKKRRKSKKNSDTIANIDINCDPDHVSSQKASCFGEEMSLSSAGVAHTPADLEGSLLLLEDNDKGRSSHVDGGAASVVLSGHAITVINQNLETAPSTICDQNKELKAKKKKKLKKSKKNSDSIVNADSNCDPDGISSEKRSYSGECLSLPSSGGTNLQADAKVSQLQLKENDKAQSSHLDREAFNGIVSGHSNNAVTQTIERAPSTTFDQKKEHKSNKGKKRKKEKKSDDSIANIDSNCDPDHVSSQKTSCLGEEMSLSSIGIAHTPADLEGSLLLLEDNEKTGSSHVDGGAASGILSGHVTLVNQNLETSPSNICDQNKELKAKKKKKQKKSKKNNDNALNADSNCDPDVISSRDNFTSVSSCLLDQSGVNSEHSNMNLPSPVVNTGVKSSRKLLILDLNGLLADIRFAAVKGYKPIMYIARRAVYKRPFCDDFLDFCFQNFDVGAWSSRKREAMESISTFLLQRRKKRLVFCWNQSHCTKTRYKTIEDGVKPIFLKELQMLWDNEFRDPKCNWEKGFYNESNTLLIDDTPYKALRNPPCTAIFPKSYECTNLNDNFLGPNGELRLYLKRLAAAENVQEFVKENPIGQSPITDAHPSWDYYSKVMDRSSNLCGQKKVHKESEDKK